MKKNSRVGRLSGIAQLLLLPTVAYICLGVSLVAQTFNSGTTENLGESWTAVTEVKTPTSNPTRLIESHTQDGNRTLDKKLFQVTGFDRHFEFYKEIETETVQVGANTVRTTTRLYGPDLSKPKTLVQVTEEEKHTVPSGDSNVVRITFRSDLNGRLEPVKREVVETKIIGSDVAETNTTVLLPSINGGFVPSEQTREVQKRDATNKVVSQMTTLLPDGSGNWKVSEVRENTNDGPRTEERVYQPNFEGKLGEVSRSVSKKAEVSSGEKRETRETYSIDVVGLTRDRSLHLVERATTTERSDTTGEQVTVRQVETTNPGDPHAEVRLSEVISETVRPSASGVQATLAIHKRDVNGNFGVVEVDTKKFQMAPSIQSYRKGSEKLK